MYVCICNIYLIDSHLGGRFIPTRKTTTGIQRLKLGRNHYLGLPIDIIVARAVKARHLVVVRPLEFNMEGAVAEGQGGGESEGEVVLLEVVRHANHFDFFRAAFGGVGDMFDEQFLGVEDNGGGLFHHLEVDFFVAIKDEPVWLCGGLGRGICEYVSMCASLTPSDQT